MRFILLPFLILVLPTRLSAQESIDLPSAVKRALAHSSDLAQARLDIISGQAQRSSVFFSLLPAISLGWSESAVVSYEAPDSRTKKISASVSQQIFDGGEALRRLRREERRNHLARRQLLFLEEELTSQVVERYAGILAWRSRRRTLEEALDAACFQLSIAQEEARLGLCTETDVLLAALELKDLQQERADAELKEKRAHYDFGRLLGCRDGQTPLAKGDIDFLYRGSINPRELASFLDAARKNSIHIHRLSLQMEETRDALRSAQGQGLPEVSLGADFSLSGPDFPLSRPGLGLHLRIAWSAPEFPLSLQLGAGREGSYQRSRGLDAGFGPFPRRGSEGPSLARARMELAARDFSARYEELGFAVREELAAVEQLREAADLLREKVVLRERRREILELMVEIGEAPRIDLMREGIAVFQARIAVIQGVMNLFQREAGLLSLCGLPLSLLSSTPILLTEGGRG